MMARIAVLITCFNRRDTTLAALSALFAQELPPDNCLDVFLADDGSTDGTGATVQDRFPQVHVCQGTGFLYWNGALRLAWEVALKEDFNFYLWLNDDTFLNKDALRLLLATYISLKAVHGELIVVGTTRDPITGVHNYGGLKRRSWLRRLRFDLIPFHDIPVCCDSMNGNCVLVPSSIVRHIGILNAAFSHSMSMGDIDYGLRATAAGFSIWVMPGHVGTCRSNSDAGTWRDTSLGIVQCWRKLRSPKTFAPRQRLVYVKAHAGMLWPICWASPYVSVLARGMRRWFRRSEP